MKIYIRHVNPIYGFDFDITDAFDSPTEKFVMGFNHQHNQVSIMGILEKNGKMYFYDIKQLAKGYYTRLAKLKVGKTAEICSDISSGFWGSQDAIKVPVSQTINIILHYTQYDSVSKTPSGFLTYTGQMGVHKQL